jgi:hypothetical protein
LSKGSVGLQGTAEQQEDITVESQYADTLIRAFNIKVLLERLKEVLATLKIRTLYM